MGLDINSHNEHHAAATKLSKLVVRQQTSQLAGDVLLILMTSRCLIRVLHVFSFGKHNFVVLVQRAGRASSEGVRFSGRLRDVETWTGGLSSWLERHRRPPAAAAAPFRRRRRRHHLVAGQSWRRRRASRRVGCQNNRDVINGCFAAVRRLSLRRSNDPSQRRSPAAARLSLTRIQTTKPFGLRLLITALKSISGEEKTLFKHVGPSSPGQRGFSSWRSISEEKRL